jgi:PhnB protein
MTQVNPYLIFNGNCEEAFLFYQSVFGGEFPYMGRFKDMPADENCPPTSEEEANRIMHVSLPIGNTVLMGSDSTSQSGDAIIGTNISVSVNTTSKEEADKIYNGLASGGDAFMPMTQTFWGAYFGMLKDKFGIHWMVNFDENPKA